MSAKKSRQDWETLAQSLEIKGQALIGGELRDAESGDTFACISPVDGRILANVASCDLADANLAVSNARAMFESGAWHNFLRLSERKSLSVLLN